MVALTAAAYREAIANGKVGQRGGHVAKCTSPATASKPLSAAQLERAYGASGKSSPQRTLTPQSSCADLETSSSSAASQRDASELAPRVQVAERPMPAWLRRDRPAYDSSASAASTPPAMPAWLCRDRPTDSSSGSSPAPAPSNARSVRKGGAFAAEMRPRALFQESASGGTRSNLRARGDAVLASVGVGPAPFAGAGQSPSPPSMWWPGNHATGGELDAGYYGGMQSGGFDAWNELPMKVDVDSFATSRFALAPPPGL